jgi:hypothetical protein
LAAIERDWSYCGLAADWLADRIEALAWEAVISRRCIGQIAPLRFFGAWFINSPNRSSVHGPVIVSISDPSQLTYYCNGLDALR